MVVTVYVLNDLKRNRKLELRGFKACIVLKKHRKDCVRMTMSPTAIGRTFDEIIERAGQCGT